jgi:hypothetical protein
VTNRRSSPASATTASDVSGGGVDSVGGGTVDELTGPAASIDVVGPRPEPVGVIPLLEQAASTENTMMQPTVPDR